MVALNIFECLLLHAVSFADVILEVPGGPKASTLGFQGLEYNTENWSHVIEVPFARTIQLRTWTSKRGKTIKGARRSVNRRCSAQYGTASHRFLECGSAAVVTCNLKLFTVQCYSVLVNAVNIVDYCLVLFQRCSVLFSECCWVLLCAVEYCSRLFSVGRCCPLLFRSVQCCSVQCWRWLLVVVLCCWAPLSAVWCCSILFGIVQSCSVMFSVGEYCLLLCCDLSQWSVLYTIHQSCSELCHTFECVQCFMVADSGAE